MMGVQVDVLIKEELLNVSHSKRTELNMRLIKPYSGEFF